MNAPTEVSFTQHKEEWCPLCMKRGKMSKVKLYQINLHDAAVLCTEPNCSYPFHPEYKDIFVKRDVFVRGSPFVAKPIDNQRSSFESTVNSSNQNIGQGVASGTLPIRTETNKELQEWETYKELHEDKSDKDSFQEDEMDRNELQENKTNGKELCELNSLTVQDSNNADLFTENCEVQKSENSTRKLKYTDFIFKSTEGSTPKKKQKAVYKGYKRRHSRRSHVQGPQTTKIDSTMLVDVFMRDEKHITQGMEEMCVESIENIN